MHISYHFVHRCIQTGILGLLILLLAACGGTGGSTNSTGTSNTTPTTGGSTSAPTSSAGKVTEFPLPNFSASGTPDGITAGPDHNLWFAEFRKDEIGRITSGK